MSLLRRGSKVVFKSSAHDYAHDVIWLYMVLYEGMLKLQALGFDPGQTKVKYYWQVSLTTRLSLQAVVMCIKSWPVSQLYGLYGLFTK